MSRGNAFADGQHDPLGSIWWCDSRPWCGTVRHTRARTTVIHKTLLRSEGWVFKGRGGVRHFCSAECAAKEAKP